MRPFLRRCSSTGSVACAGAADPPRIASTYSLAAWTFLAEVAKDVIAPAVVERFTPLLDRHVGAIDPSLSTLENAGVTLHAEPGRVVLRRPGRDEPPRRSRPWQWLTVVVNLGRPEDGEDYGSRLCRPSPDGNAGQKGDDISRAGSRDVSFRANTALVVFAPSGGLDYVPIPASAPGEIARHSWEFHIGPTPRGRRTLTSVMTTEGAGEARTRIQGQLPDAQ